MEDQPKRSTLERASWIAAVVGTVIAFITWIQSMAADTAKGDPPVSTSPAANPTDQAQQNNEADIIRAAREAELINQSRQKQGI